MKKKLLSIACLFFLQFSYAQSVVLDPTFGVGGIVKTDIDSMLKNNNVGIQVIRQADGSLYFISYYPLNIEQDDLSSTVITKKKADGTTDLTYGVNGYVAIPLLDGHAAIQQDGKIIIAGVSTDRQTFYNDAHSGLMRINTNGTLDNDFNKNIQKEIFVGYSWVTVQPDGLIVVLGTFSSDDARQYIVLSRFNANGTLQKTVNTDFGNQDYGISLAIGDDKKIVVGCGSSLLRYNTDLSLDLSFNGDGHVPVTELVNTVAIQSDGRILTGNIVIRRYKVNGEIDNSFNNNGVQTIGFGGSNDRIISILTQPNGKIIASGYTVSGTAANFAVARFLTNGSPDNTFAGDGSQVTNFNGIDNRANSAVIQTDGKIIALGYTIDAGITYTVAAKYNIDGTLDNTFSRHGTMIDTIKQGSTYYTSTALQTDGKVVAAGYTWNGTNYDFAIARYNINGRLDINFSADGKQTVDFTASNDRALAMAIQPDGKIVMAGYAGGNFALARLTTNGSLDLSFNGTGKQITDFGGVNTITSLFIQTDGKILVGGTTELVRYNPNGSLDISFDGDGKLTIPYNCNSLVVQADGKIITTSGTFNGSYACRVNRYNNDGSLDVSFGDNGTRLVYARYGNADFYDKSVTIDKLGRIVIGGYSQISVRDGHFNAFEFAVLNPDGSFDPTVNSGQNVNTVINNFDFGTSIKIQFDNKIILGGSSYNGAGYNYAMARYNTDGTPDITFGSNGILQTAVSTANNKIANIAIVGNAIYAAGFGVYPGAFGVVAKYLMTAAAPLPVTLTTFTATIQNKKTTLLQWQTESEQNLAGFTVERSTGSNNFSPIGYTTAKGNNSIKVNYSIIDPQPVVGINYYRLKMIDINGRFVYSKIIPITITDAGFTLILSPNPVRNTLYIKATGSNENAMFVIIDGAGKKVSEVKAVLNGSTSISIDINTLAKGAYTLQLQTATLVETRRFIKE